MAWSLKDAVKVRTEPIIRFWRFIDFGADDECWLWTGGTAGSGGRYGYFREGSKSNDKRVPAHRWIYEYLFGALAPDLQMDHLCRNKCCVNPWHLEKVTHTENMRRVRLTVCRAGLHDLSNPDTCRWDSRGFRRGCLKCWQEKQTIRKAKGKEVQN